MRKLMFPGKLGKAILHALTILALIGVFIFAPPATHNVAASATVPVNMIYYGWHDTTVDNSIVNAHPEFLVDNSPAGPWKGNASISKFTSAGIKFFEYIDGGYEGTAAQAIPNDLQSNLNYINAAAAAGAYGIFLDEVSSNPSSTSLNYLKQIADRAHSLGLKVVFNSGVDSWSDSLMIYCDIMNSSEIWNNASLTTSQNKWASRTWLLSQNVTDATTASNLTDAALNKGISAHYACTSYGALPTWLGSYVAQISSSTPTPAPTPTPTPTPVLVAPTVATGVATGITINGATLNGNLSNMGSNNSISVSFEWGLTASYGNITSASTMTNIGAFNTPITGLTSNTTYHFRVKAVGSATVYGSDQTFMTLTPIVALTIATGTASRLALTSATLNGTLTDKGSASSVNVSFEWGTTTTYGKTTKAKSMTTTGAFYTTITGLKSNTTYHFRVKAVGGTTVYGSDRTFKTATSTPVSGNTVGTVMGTPVASGGANEYCLNLKVTSTTVSGVKVGQQVWCAATTTNFPNLLTSGATLTGTLDHSPGWWVIKP